MSGKSFSLRIGNDTLEVPDELPLLPVRNTVVFPGVTLPLSVGRPKSLAAVQAAARAGGFLAVVSQRAPETEQPGRDDRAPAEIIYYLYTVAPEHDVTRGGEARLEHGEADVRRLCLFDEYLGRNRARIRDEIFKGSRQLAEKLLRAAMSFDHESVYVDEHDSL